MRDLTENQNPCAGRRLVRGDLLSCFTSAFAEYLEALGLDHEFALGTQVFLAVRGSASGGLSFIHQHTPLRGETSCYKLHLKRCHTGDPDEAMTAILAEQARSGAVIIASEVGRLHWQVAYSDASAPHWFVVDDVRDGFLHVCDRFQYLLETGTQPEFVGELSRDQLRTWAKPMGERLDLHARRERSAFGDSDHDEALGHSGFHWYELQKPPHAITPDRLGIHRAFEKTWAYQSGTVQRTDLAGDGWACGVDAIGFLARYLEDSLEDATAYVIRDDLWVAGRVRGQFAQALARFANELDSTSMRELVTWSGQRWLVLWSAIPRVMQYNVGCIQRGRRPPRLLVDTLNQIVQEEQEFLQRLQEVISTAK